MIRRAFRTGVALPSAASSSYLADAPLSTSQTSTAALSSALTIQKCFATKMFRTEQMEGALDLQAASAKVRKGPPVAHSLPVYKTAHKLNYSIRWKTANLVAQLDSGKNFRLRETQGEGTFDETGQYRDWLYGDERRFANWTGCFFFLVSAILYWYTIKIMGAETWEIPAPVLASHKRRMERQAQEQQGGDQSIAKPAEMISQEEADALKYLKSKPATITKAAA